MRFRCFVAAACVLIGSNLAARAQSFDFSFTGPDNGSGTFTTTTTSTPGEFLVTGVSGTVDGSAITTLLAPGTFPTFDPPPNDNLLFFPAPDLDFEGIAFEDAAGELFNILDQTGSYGEVTATSLSGDNSTTGFFTTFTVTEVPTTVPESSSPLYAFISAAALAFGFVLRKRLVTSPVLSPSGLTQ
jgi:hypothetical protein